jgi:hypothetical protein
MPPVVILKQRINQTVSSTSFVLRLAIVSHWQKTQKNTDWKQEATKKQGKCILGDKSKSGIQSTQTGRAPRSYASRTKAATQTPLPQSQTQKHVSQQAYTSVQLLERMNNPVEWSGLRKPLVARQLEARAQVGDKAGKRVADWQTGKIW